MSKIILLAFYIILSSCRANALFVDTSKYVLRKSSQRFPLFIGFTHTHARERCSLYLQPCMGLCVCVYGSSSLQVLSHSFSSRRPLGTWCSINPLLFMDLGRYFHAPAARSSFSSFYLFFFFFYGVGKNKSYSIFSSTCQ